MRRVVVTGLGSLTPVGLNTKESWKNALAGTSGIARIASFDPADIEVKIAGEVKGFDPLHFIKLKELKKSPRFVQFSIAAAHEAINDASLDLDKEKMYRYGCAVGVGIGAIGEIEETSYAFKTKGTRRVSPFFIPSVIANMAAGNTATYFGLKGPNICTTTACASGTHAIGEAWMYVKQGMADVMICGGSESAVTPLTMTSFSNMKALSKNNENPSEASCPFDKRRNGFVLSEGCGLLVLEEYEHAVNRGAKIYAELVGYGMSCDAYHITAPTPRGEGFYRCMEAAVRCSGFDFAAVNYINAHGTSTYYNDLYETQAIQDLFQEHAEHLLVSSTKGATGHCLGAAGGIEAVFLAKAVAEQVVPPTANLVQQDPLCTLQCVPNTAKSADIVVGMSNSFGFGGTNASIVMTKCDG